jgi:hypothetical protein
MTDEQMRDLLQRCPPPEAPEGYYEELLRSLHHRQRAELLKRPLWRIALERFSTFWSEHSVSAPAYALALTALAVGGLASIFWLGHAYSGSPENATTARQTPPPAWPPSSAEPETPRLEPKKNPVETQQVRFQNP